MIEHGQKVVESACAACHGMNGISDAEGKPHIAGQRTVYVYRVLKAFQDRVRHDLSSNHNGFLNDEALLSASVYYANQAPVTVSSEIEGNDSLDAAEEDPFSDIREAMDKCIKCHDETGNSTRSGMPNLTAQDPDYFLTSMQAYVNGNRSHKLMKKLVAKLDEATIRKMGVFYAVQTPARTEILGEGDHVAGRLIAEECVNCHAGDGNAQGREMPTLAGQDARYFVKAMKAYGSGKRQHEDMFKASEQLSDDDLINLATFYATQEPMRRNVRIPLTSSAWIERCERCHGIDGNSSDARFPMLAGQDKTYLRNALQAYAGGGRTSAIMHAMSAPLSEADIEKIATHFASQHPKSVVYMQSPCDDVCQK